MKRGEIYYISGAQNAIGSEQMGNRPGIIVSNNKNNENSKVVEIVYLTTRTKATLPTHVTVMGTGRESTALCEQITTVSVDRIREYSGKCSDREMEKIDKACLASLGLLEKKVENEPMSENKAEIERDIYKQLYEQLLSQLTG